VIVNEFRANKAEDGERKSTVKIRIHKNTWWNNQTVAGGPKNLPVKRQPPPVMPMAMCVLSFVAQ